MACFAKNIQLMQESDNDEHLGEINQCNSSQLTSIYVDELCLLTILIMATVVSSMALKLDIQIGNQICNFLCDTGSTLSLIPIQLL